MSTKTPQPEIGMGATLCYPDDRYPYVVTSVTKTTIVVEPLVTVSKATGHPPTRMRGPFPIWDHAYSPDEMATLRHPDGRSLRRRAHRRKDGRFYLHGTPLLVGEARYRRDYSD